MFISPTKTRKQKENTEIQGRIFLFMFEQKLSVNMVKNVVHVTNFIPYSYYMYKAPDSV